MASLQDILTSAYINLVCIFMSLMGFAILRLLPINNRVYFAKWCKEKKKSSLAGSGTSLKKFGTRDFKGYLMFWSWMPEGLKMPDRELINYAGLDSVAYIRIYLVGLKIFVPVAILTFLILVPLNLTGETLKTVSNLSYNNIDKLSISNIPSGSLRLSAHVIMAYVVTVWTCYVLYNEYKFIAKKRLKFIASEKRRPYQFTVLVRNIPPEGNGSVSKDVEQFFCVNHPEHYLTHQVVYNTTVLARLVKARKRLRSLLTYYETLFEKNPENRPQTKIGLWGLFGDRVDALTYYGADLERTIQEEEAEWEKVTKDPEYIIPAAFVSFRSRWAAVVCAQTQQSYDPTEWLTQQAPEPRDVYWKNLSIPHVRRSVNRLIIIVSMIFLTLFFMIPIAFVQSMASIEGMQLVLVFLKPLIQRKRVKNIVQGYLPGIILKIFTAALPTILMHMSKMEGHISRSTLDRKMAGKFHFFILVNVFFGSILTGAAFQQLDKFLRQSASQIPRTMGVSMPMKATFFITYIMVDGWTGVALEIIRLVPLIKYHLNKAFLVRSEWDKERARQLTSLNFTTMEPQIQLYFLLGLVYSVVSPLILPFIIVSFGLSYVIYRYQIINVYDQKYETAASFWPDVQKRVIYGLVIAQVLLMGLLSTKNALESTPCLLILPVLTIWFHKYCEGRFKPAFLKFPLQVVMKKDVYERANEPKLDLRPLLQEAYAHPVMRDTEIDESEHGGGERSLEVDKEKGSGASSPVSSSSEENVEFREDVKTGVNDLLVTLNPGTYEFLAALNPVGD